jgi:DNA helicase II / ATP-dependent DNA helicase PcrA
VVGDDSQSIYSFRGANIENILNFKKTYPEGKLFKLEQNYRSTKTIVDAANSLISKNKGQIPKKVFSKQEQGAKIRVLTAYSDLEEGFMVSNKIAELRQRNLESYNDFVILYRTNAQSRIFEEALRKRNLPYRVYGGLSFYQRKEIKDVIAYLRLLLNSSDEEAFKRIVNVPARGIGETTQQKLLHAASDAGVSLWQVLSDIPTYQVPVNSGTLKKLDGFRAVMEALNVQASVLNVFELTQKLLADSGMDRELNADKSPENLSRKDNIQALLAGMNEFVNSRIEEDNPSIFVWDYLQEVSLLSDQDEEKNSAGERITLMTIHAAKGLEFKNVFVVGLEEDIFPSMHSLDSEKNLEEERRLLYVALTRAEHTCILSFAKSRFRNGQNNFTRPSRFLKDLDPALLDYPSDSGAFESTQTSRVFERETAFERNDFNSNRANSSTSRFESKTTKPTVEPLRPVKKLTKLDALPTNHATTGQSDFASDVTGLHVGCQIAHERFGEGVVKSLEGTGDNAKIEVEFTNSGYRKLLLKFARFTIVQP